MSYRVQVLQTQEMFAVNPDESILAAAQRANVNLAHDCTLGGCGTCRIKLIEGRVIYNEPPFALTPEEESEGYALACQAMPTSDLVISAAALADVVVEPARHTAIISDIQQLGTDVSRLVLEIPENDVLTYLPGQYMNVLLPDGSTRSFSMASAPKDTFVDFHVRRIDGGAFTEGKLPYMRAGDRLDVEFPHGTFVFHARDDRPLLMVATGTGLAPIKAILEALMDNPDCPPVSLYWGARSASDLYLHDEIQAWGERLYEFRYVPVLSRPDRSWQGCRGYVQDAVAGDLDDLSDYAIYLCGSPAMIFDAKQTFITRGAAIDHIYTEGFTFQHAQSAAA
ncbi:2Fe-2S iron-sulfur cluster-binding protein [Pseudorhodoplanes sinuspersici]|uniref:CDP-6-deoxy-delta-3,4-glucoseen reductase n=1 Tax=Pseudorhodoplanes sinuspersici TaxID=1235591 RepID=A0A1W6ZZZ2_9HYPH|nr:2Fe-2S iron-sulfur cluster-binding protein [Pseudorhodoplanes sinuspersici]ARQ02926.1 CDP-6-deoxy-delta-3,4-glucoseen reductase [Pseudorhodoplanes sinuspersici]RKE70807.1 CDP-4-dehydro-6-deoxyglucose reductase [Pseudorhodoplanes sinuspersici]